LLRLKSDKDKYNSKKALINNSNGVESIMGMSKVKDKKKVRFSDEVIIHSKRDISQR
jgi:hypothetical protein